jgi:hypothetical protein
MRGNQRAREHGLAARYLTVADLATAFPDPAERARVLATVMTHRALAAHDLTAADPDRDTEATARRIATAVRVATQATRVELAARAAGSSGGTGEDALAERLARAKLRTNDDR